MREWDLKAPEFDNVVALVTELAVSEPGRRRAAALRPSTNPDEVRARLRTTAELAELRARAGSVAIDDPLDSACFIRQCRTV